jgi:apolipoprotein N-acyltransferase
VLAIYRAIENGVSLLRPARWADSVATDPYGRVLALMDHFATEDRRMMAWLPVRGVRTVYSQVGDAFAWACVAGFIAISAWAMTR